MLTDHDTSSQSRSNITIPAGVGGGSAVVIIAAVVALLVLWKRRYPFNITDVVDKELYKNYTNANRLSVGLTKGCTLFLLTTLFSKLTFVLGDYYIRL